MLLIGYGNRARGDDGLGPELAARVAALGLPQVAVEEARQLGIEHAPALAGHGLVVFADAAVGGEEPFAFRRIEPAAATPGFTSHHVSPEVVLALARACYGAAPEAYVLAIGGRDFDGFDTALSEPARRNLDAAVAFLADFIEQASRRLL